MSRPRSVCSSSSEMAPFKPKQQPAVDRGRLIHAVAIGDQAAHAAAEIEQLIPVGAVAGQPRGIVGHDHADLAQRDLGGQPLEIRRGHRSWLRCGPGRRQRPRSPTQATRVRHVRRVKARCNRWLSVLVSTWCGLDWRM